MIVEGLPENRIEVPDKGTTSLQSEAMCKSIKKFDGRPAGGGKIVFTEENPLRYQSPTHNLKKPLVQIVSGFRGCVNSSTTKFHRQNASFASEPR